MTSVTKERRDARFVKLSASLSRYETAMREALAALEWALSKVPSFEYSPLQKVWYCKFCSMSSNQGSGWLIVHKNDCPLGNAVNITDRAEERPVIAERMDSEGFRWDSDSVDLFIRANGHSCNLMARILNDHDNRLWNRAQNEIGKAEAAEEPAESKLEAIRAVVEHCSHAHGITSTTCFKCRILAILDAQPSTPEPKP